ncbi:DUF6300 family protein [Streptomyces sp. NBC_01446]|uniref:DUF6300 family protein n=1 Tax=Streptomyces sp. NBC_01446 TaxID=2903870 RepID=UPI00225891B2|nr:DUF6300 family protein [Streptomyces sp. NBC_01446]MCX4648198.1 DUF6300 family protein [Streptomyces sp. NBC_01446]
MTDVTEEQQSGIQDDEEILLKIEVTPPCPKCEETTVLVAQFANAWTNRRGQDVRGLREAALCVSTGCDPDNPAAADLLALFAVDKETSPDNLETFSGLTAASLKTDRHHTADEEPLNKQLEPAAADLLALLASDKGLSPDNLETFGGLTAAWLESVRHRTADEELLNGQLEQWQRGDL